MRISRSRARWAVFALGMYMLVLSPSPVSVGAEPSTDPRRAWTDSTGKHTIQAEFVDFKDGTVRLRKQDGKDIAVPIEKLSDADRQFAQQQSKGKSIRKGLPKELAVDLGGGVKLEMVLVPAGSFIMGWPRDNTSRAPYFEHVHKVNITKPFYLGKYEVTQEQWQAVMGNNPSHDKGAKKPVETVTWDDCQKFLAKLNTKIGTKEGKFVLPTEAQWEYSCRAGSKSRFYFGDDEKQIDKYAWYLYNAGNRTHPVGEKKPNAWGLYDMCGNVSEWCADWFGPDYYPKSPADDPSGPATGSERVTRGGDVTVGHGACFSANRGNLLPGFKRLDVGLRVCRVPADK